MTKVRITKNEYDEMQAALNTVRTLQTFNSILDKRRISFKDPSSIPQQLSEKQSKSAIEIEKVKFPDSGGTYTVYKDKPYEMKGFNDGETVDKIAEVKKDVILVMQFFRLVSRRRILGGLFFLIFRKELEKLFNNWVEQSWHNLQSFLIEDIRYCDFVRELRRCWPEGNEKLRDIISMVLEFDDAYRYRFQHAFGNFNQKNFIDNPTDEIKKYFDYLYKKEKKPEIMKSFKMNLKDKWSTLGKISFLLKYNKKILNPVYGMFKKINVDKLKMSEEDKYWCQNKVGFNW